jgi:hypothetical protein
MQADVFITSLSNDYVLAPDEQLLHYWLQTRYNKQLRKKITLVSLGSTTMKIWNIETGECKNTYTSPESGVKTIIPINDHQIFSVGKFEEKMWSNYVHYYIFDITTEKFIRYHDVYPVSLFYIIDEGTENWNYNRSNKTFWYTISVVLQFKCGMSKKLEYSLR